MIATVYIRAASKAAANRLLAANPDLTCLVFQQLETSSPKVKDLPAGTVVKIFDHCIDGSPFAKAYGNIAQKPNGQVFIK